MDELERHLSVEHMTENDELQRKRFRKRIIRPKEEPTVDQTSDLDDSSELNMLDETRESRNPNFECW